MRLWLAIVLLLILPQVSLGHMFCNMDASESDIQAACLAGTAYNGGTILFADDFEDGVWMNTDADHGGTGDAANDGWRGTIFSSPYPKNATAGGAAGTSYTADSGFINGDPNGSGVQAQGYYGKHEFYPSLGTAVTEIYFRQYIKFSSGFEPGHQKLIFYQNDSGYQCCGTNAVFNTFDIGTDIFHASNSGWKYFNISSLTPVAGRWYYLETHIKLGTPGGSDGVYEAWMDDCGVSGTECTGTPTLRAQHTGQIMRDTSGEDLTLIWLESWGNPGSNGTIYWDQLVASTAFVGFAGVGGGGGSSTGGSMDVKQHSSDLIFVSGR